MKLAAFGLIVGAAGLVLGVDGLLIAGGLWIVTGLLLRTLIQRSESSFPLDAGLESEVGRIETSGDRRPRIGLPGAFLLLVSGLGSIAIGVIGVGFSGDYEVLRWLPVAVGAYITLIGLISIPVELSQARSSARSDL